MFDSIYAQPSLDGIESIVRLPAADLYAKQRATDAVAGPLSRMFAQHVPDAYLAGVVAVTKTHIVIGTSQITNCNHRCYRFQVVTRNPDAAPVTAARVITSAVAMLKDVLRPA